MRRMSGGGFLYRTTTLALAVEFKPLRTFKSSSLQMKGTNIVSERGWGVQILRNDVMFWCSVTTVYVDVVRSPTVCCVPDGPHRLRDFLLS